jgi:hypothetical protein
MGFSICTVPSVLTPLIVAKTTILNLFYDVWSFTTLMNDVAPFFEGAPINKF